MQLFLLRIGRLIDNHGHFLRRESRVVVDLNFQVDDRFCGGLIAQPRLQELLSLESLPRLQLLQLVGLLGVLLCNVLHQVTCVGYFEVLRIRRRCTMVLLNGASRMIVVVANACSALGVSAAGSVPS